MNKYTKGSETKNNNVEKTLKSISVSKDFSFAVYFIHIVIFISASILTNIVSRSAGSIMISGRALPMSSFAGIFSSLSNICIVSMVVLFKKRGFITAILLLVPQPVILLVTLAKTQNLQSLPGLFNILFAFLAIILLNLSDSKMRKFQERIREQAVTDGLTGLPNRFACVEFVNDLMDRKLPFAVVSIDLNNFKSINDTLGHDTGNKVLISIAERWKTVADSGKTGTFDFVIRLGGDEFALIIRGFHSEDEIIKTINCYESELEKKLTVDECDLFLTASYGYAVYPSDAETGDALFTCADVAMHKIKSANNSDHVCHISPEILNSENTLEMEHKIRLALENETIFFNLQPQYDISHKLRGFEALARMKDSSGDLISPGYFIPVAEKVGIIDKVDLMVFRNAAKFFGKLVSETGANITLSINVSVRHLMKNGFIDEIKNIIESCNVPPEQLEIEITESIMIDSAEKALQCINDIRAMGIKIAIDDFGTGYSSLSYLYNFPADLLKVDKSFIDKMNSSDSSKKYVEAIISIGHIMNFDVISEGVEEPEQLETLRSIGCDYIQGFIWGRPMSPEDAEKVVRAEMQNDTNT